MVAVSYGPSVLASLRAGGGPHTPGFRPDVRVPQSLLRCRWWHRQCSSRPAWGRAPRERARSAPRAGFRGFLRWARVTEPALGRLRPAPRRTRGGDMSNPHSKLRRQQQLGAHAHRMRRAPSEPERVLWRALRCCQLGVQFRRQVVLQGLIVDFFAPTARLVVEVDGAHHTRQRGADQRRDRALAAAGLKVLRLPAQLVLGSLAVALERVRSRSSPSSVVRTRRRRRGPSIATTW
jgi:very-short-patch-repair endonuclease